MPEPEEILKRYWGYQSFRPLQLEIITSILSGNDTLALMPTGGGKSICFQLPAIVNEGICLVISPLIALMKDQVTNLVKRGIPALSIYSGMSFVEVTKTLKNAAYGNFKFLYVSPERLETELFLEYLPAIKINLIAVDEAHCISQWGYDFRPPYLKIASIRENLKGVPVLALTASATAAVQDDICDKLHFNSNQQRFHQSFERSNLSYSVFNPSSKQNKLLEVLTKVNGSGIVYCKSRRRTREIEELLSLNGISASHYHAGLTSELRNKRQEEWLNNKTRIIACTNAFGMGIDKPDVRTVVHYDVPDALENYYQEAGRAGRDKKKAYAVLLFNDTEIADLKKQSLIRFPDLHTIKSVYGSLVNYLQLPSGSGEDVAFEFDISDFIKKFRLDIFTVNSVLKILEQEELISYNDQFYSPSTAVFTSVRSEVDLFTKTHPEYDRVIKGLLRSYEGVFDYTTAINESHLAKFISMTREQVGSALIEIKRMGIIDYIPQTEKPQLRFLQNRVNAADLVVNQKNILKRKKAFEKRLEAILKYVENTDACRSKLIASYFNDKTVKRCGICDNCLQEKNVTISTEEFQKIRAGIEISIAEKPLHPDELILKLRGFKKNKIWKILHYLQEESIVSFTEEGVLIMQGKKP